MSKYNFDLDMNSENSNSVILKSIKPNSEVLEIGSAHGRMTKYLKEQLNCIVDIAETDFEAGTHAKGWARDFYLDDAGNVEGDLFRRLNNYGYHSKKYDVVIFADVLEHLKDPEWVLKSTKSVLKPNASIWISIPNSAYNGIICELINDEFQYRDVGLLDVTHIKFFTNKSLLEMVERSGYKVVMRRNLKNAVDCSEFIGAYNLVPDYVAEFLKSRAYGEVYQFVWELKTI